MTAQDFLCKAESGWGTPGAHRAPLQSWL